MMELINQSLVRQNAPWERRLSPRMIGKYVCFTSSSTGASRDSLTSLDLYGAVEHAEAGDLAVSADLCDPGVGSRRILNKHHERPGLVS